LHFTISVSVAVCRPQNEEIVLLLKCYSVLNYDTSKDKMPMEDEPSFISPSDRKRLATLYGSLRMLDDAYHFRCRTRQRTTTGHTRLPVSSFSATGSRLYRRAHSVM